MSKSVKDLLKEKLGITRPIKEVNGGFDCFSISNLTSLEGCPKIINGYFDCRFNNLTSLEGAPQITKDCDFSGNKLKSLEGAPKLVKGDFYINNNMLTSLEGSPKDVKGNFICHTQDSGKKFTKDEVKQVCNVKGSIYV